MQLKPLTEEESKILHIDIDYCIINLQDLLHKYEEYAEELDSFSGNYDYIERLGQVLTLIKLHRAKLQRRKPV